MKRVVIGGGGISGLALAWALRRHGISALVLEAALKPGGKLASERVDGFLVENGPQSFRFRDPVAAALVRELGLEPKLLLASSASRRRGVAIGDGVEAIPLSPMAFARSRIAPASTKARLLLELALPRAGGEGDESVAEFGRRRFGAVAAERFFFPMISGLYTGDPEVLSLASAFPSLSALEREHRSLLLGALAGLRRAVTGPHLATFQDGMGTLPLALGERLGGDLRLGATISSVRRSGSGWAVEISCRGEREDLTAAAVVLTLPSHAASPVLQAADASLASVVGRISYAPIVMVHLGYASDGLPALPMVYGFYTPSTESSPLLGAVFTSQLFPLHAPPGHAFIACRMGGAREPDLLDRSDGELVERAHGELVRLLKVRREPRFTRVVRHARALPQYTVGHREQVEAIEAAVKRHPGLFLAGNAYRGLGILDCLRHAEPLAQRIADHLSWPFPSSH